MTQRSPFGLAVRKFDESRPVTPKSIAPYPTPRGPMVTVTSRCSKCSHETSFEVHRATDRLGAAISVLTVKPGLSIDMLARYVGQVLDQDPNDRDLHASTVGSMYGYISRGQLFKRDKGVYLTPPDPTAARERCQTEHQS